MQLLVTGSALDFSAWNNPPFIDITDRSMIGIIAVLILRFESFEKMENWGTKWNNESLSFYEKIKAGFQIASFISGLYLVVKLFEGEYEFSLFEELKNTENFLNAVLSIILYLNLLYWLFYLSYSFHYFMWDIRIFEDDKTEPWIEKTGLILSSKKTKNSILKGFDNPFMKL